MSLRQGQILSQKLIISNAMMQSLAILQMPITELVETIKKEMDENPLLEEDYSEKENEIFDKIMDTDFDRNELFLDDDKQNPWNYSINKRFLKDFLYEQLCYLNEPNKTKLLMAYMIENIDRRGYLGCTLKDIAEEMAVPEENVYCCLRVLQDFQPDGVFARDLEECLRIQLRKKNVNIAQVYKIVESCLPLLSENKIRDIAQELNISISEAAEYCNMIVSLEPKPSRGFAEGADDVYIMPEAYILKDKGSLSVLINEAPLPKLRISRGYRSMYNDDSRKEAKAYIKDRLNAALFLIKNVEQRKNTIYNILTAITAEQEEYFNNGGNYLKPMTIHKIADEIGCHESTVSRAIRDKYVQTPLGLITIKSLFTSKCGEGEISSNVIKNRIQTLILNENKRLPLSDQQIADILYNGNIEVSRRTVSKYREDMGIPSSKKRKKYE